MNPTMLWNALSLSSNGLNRKQPVKTSRGRPKGVAKRLKKEAAEKRQKKAQRRAERAASAKKNQYDNHPEKT